MGLLYVRGCEIEGQVDKEGKLVPDEERLGFIPGRGNRALSQYYSLAVFILVCSSLFSWWTVPKKITWRISAFSHYGNHAHFSSIGVQANQASAISKRQLSSLKSASQPDDRLPFFVARIDVTPVIFGLNLVLWSSKFQGHSYRHSIIVVCPSWL